MLLNIENNKYVNLQFILSKSTRKKNLNACMYHWGSYFGEIGKDKHGYSLDYTNCI